MTTQAFLEKVLRAAGERARPVRVGYLNAAQVNLAFNDPRHARRLAGLDWLYADGQAVVWATRWLKAPIPERINAGDFTGELVRGLAVKGLKLALVGGHPPGIHPTSEADRIADRFRAWAPGLNIVYTHHGFLDEALGDQILEALEAADPDLVLLGMGAPRQERWAEVWAERGRPRVWWCVGALFEYYAGTRRRAPQWMRRAGLEWLFRLAMEPRRLFKRYVIGNPLFVWRVWRRQPPPALTSDPTSG